MQPCLRSLWSSLARSCSLSNVDFRGWISKCRFHNVEPKVRTQNFWSPESLRLKQRGTQPTRRHRKAAIALLLHDRWPVGYSGNAKLVFVSIRLMVAHRHMLATHGWTNLRPVINFWSSLNIYSSYPSEPNGRTDLLCKRRQSLQTGWGQSSKRSDSELLSSNSEQSQCAFYCGILIAFLTQESWAFMNCLKLKGHE